jgi:hypothetical protein
MTSVMSGLAVCAASSAATRAIPVHPYRKCCTAVSYARVSTHAVRDTEQAL